MQERHTPNRKTRTSNQLSDCTTQRTLTALLFSFFTLHFALSQVPPDRDVLLNAKGNGQATYAEMNGYPGPKHALDLASSLQLTKSQREALRDIYDEMASRAKELGKRIVQIEQEMHDAFRAGLVTEKSIRDDAEQIGRLRGRLRAVHLVAHLKTKNVLKPNQIELYRKLRGGQ